MSQQSIEERVAALENKIAEYEAERAQMRALEALRTEVRELGVRYQAHEEYVSDRLNTFEAHVNTRLDVIEDNQSARFQELQDNQQELQAGLTGLAGQVQELTAGQKQILDILTGGKPRTND